MSHFVTVQLNLTNETYLVEALKELGYKVRVGRRSIPNGFGQEATVDIWLEGYPIGFVKKDRGYELVADWWGTGINRVEFAHKVQQTYAKHQVLDVCKKAGLRPGQWVTKEDGTLEMVAVKSRWG